MVEVVEVVEVAVLEVHWRGLKRSVWAHCELLLRVLQRLANRILSTPRCNCFVVIMEVITYSQSRSVRNKTPGHLGGTRNKKGGAPRINALVINLVAMNAYVSS